MSFDLALPLKLLEQPLHDTIDQLRQGYQSLSECVDQAMAECEQRGVELAECRSQLAEARRSLLEQEKQLAVALAERQQAEGELDQLRRRAADLTENLAEQKRLMAEQREHWSEELRQLRRAVDRQSELLGHRPSSGADGAAVGPAPRTAAGDSKPAAAANNDQVMDTVVRQFEMLQKNKIRKVSKSAR